MMPKDKIGIIGLGYVELPLAVAFSKEFQVSGFDINPARIDELNNATDSTLEVESELLKNNANLFFSSSSDCLADCRFIIVTVPTPVNSYSI